MSNNIQILLNSGFDAFSNLYQVNIVPPGVGTALPEVRVKDFKAPTLQLGEYEQHFKTASLTRLNAQFTGEREFELTFRIDNQWTLYDELKNWRKKYVNFGSDEIYLGSYSNTIDNSDQYGEVTVKVFNGSNGLNNGLVSTDYSDVIIWNFKQVMLYDLIEPNFTRGTSNPIEITCKFIFGEYSSTTSNI